MVNLRLINIGHWCFNDNLDNHTVLDSLGRSYYNLYSQNLTSAISRVDGLVGRCFRLGGNLMNASYSEDNDFLNGFIWVRTNAGSGRLEDVGYSIIKMYTGSEGEYADIQLYNGRIRLEFKKVGQSAVYGYGGHSTIIDDGEWHMISWCLAALPLGTIDLWIDTVHQGTMEEGTEGFFSQVQIGFGTSIDVDVCGLFNGYIHHPADIGFLYNSGLGTESLDNVYDPGVIYGSSGLGLFWSGYGLGY